MKLTSPILAALALVVFYTSFLTAAQAAFSITLERNGVAVATFTEVSGLASDTEAVEYTELGPGGQQVVRKIPGRTRWQDITLKRALTSNTTLRDWRQQVETGNIAAARSNGAIIIRDSQGTVLAKWNFTNGWPNRLQNNLIPATSTSGEMLIEEFTIAHEGLERVQ